MSLIILKCISRYFVKETYYVMSLYPVFNLRISELCPELQLSLSKKWKRNSAFNTLFLNKEMWTIHKSGSFSHFSVCRGLPNPALCITKCLSVPFISYKKFTSIILWNPATAQKLAMLTMDSLRVSFFLISCCVFALDQICGFTRNCRNTH